ncbi:MAG TPA: 2-hydroxyacid dehydrogenase [Xanthobacteraceae bacterium]|nr:2-hydroxyacid dehydrogenase [Xanthobacteraceae bacterium]
MADKAEVLVLSPKKAIEDGLKDFVLHRLWTAPDREAFLAQVGPRVRAIASAGGHAAVDANLMSRLPKLEIVSSFGVGYDHVDAKWAGQHGITVTNTPDVLTEEVADTAIGLLLCTVREFPQAERYLRAGKWREKDYRLSPATLRNRTVGIIGLGRIGKAIARRLDAMLVPVVYHGRHRQPDVPYRYYDNLVAMARDADVLLAVAPGGPGTRNIINAAVLDALGPDGIVINMARGSLVDEPALIKALQEKKIFSAGLDVYAHEPKVPAELIAMDNVVLFPHLGSASLHTRQAVDQLVVDNLVAWAGGNPPLTPVPETPWPPSGRR